MSKEMGNTNLHRGLSAESAEDDLDNRRSLVQRKDVGLVMSAKPQMSMIEEKSPITNEGSKFDFEEPKMEQRQVQRNGIPDGDNQNHHLLGINSPLPVTKSESNMDRLSPNLVPKPPRSMPSLSRNNSAPRAPTLRLRNDNENEGNHHQTLTLRLSGPTNYPVMTHNASGNRASPAPGQRIPQMHYLKPNM